MGRPYHDRAPRVVATEHGSVRLLSDDGDRLGETFLDLGHPADARVTAADIIATANQIEERDRDVDPDRSGGAAPAPGVALTPSMKPGQLLEIRGCGRRIVTADGELAEADCEQPIAVLAEIGSVLFLLGCGYYAVELDTDLEAGEDWVPCLTLLSGVD